LIDEKDRPVGGGERDQMELGGEETVGEILLAAREKLGLTLEALSQETKIPAATLQYLETDNFEAIPASVYAKGFLRAYARQLGLDPAQLISKYEMQTGQTHKSRGDLWEIEEEIVEEQLGSTHLLRRFVLPAVLVIIVLVVVWRVFGGGDEGVEPPPDLPDAAVEGRADRPPEAGETASGAEPADEEGGGAQEDSRRSEQPERMEERMSRAPSGGGERRESSGEAGGELTLRITAEEQTWFDIVVFEMTEAGMDSTEDDFILEPGQSRTFTSNAYFYIRKIGKTGGFSIMLDGRPFEIPVVEGRLPRDIKISRSR
jgi:cytoskeleton protein RodZ